MFYIVESEDQLNLLKGYGRNNGYVEFIGTNDNYHPILNSTVAVFLRPLNHSKGYIIPINHPEGLNVPKERVLDVLSSYPTLYTLNRKNTLYHANIKGLVDLSLLHSMTSFDKLDISSEDSTYTWFYRKFGQLSYTNQLVPLPKLHQYYEDTYSKIEKLINLELPSGFEYYNTTATNVFYLIERSGIGIHHQPFIDNFNPNDPLYNIVSGVAYSQYNLYNTTSRPTNAFNSVNFAAIPKGEEFRKCFKPQNDYFVEFDFDGYHVRLLCEQLGYELTNESAHKQLARLYFGKDEVTEDEYVQAKQVNFQAMYGKIPTEHKHLPIFKKIQKFIDDLWQEFQTNGVVYDPISKKPLTSELKGMHPSKLMNYLMQSLETSRNITILKEALSYLRDKQTKIVLYTYDSIILDFSEDDGIEVLQQLKTILQQQNYPIKYKYSKTLVL